MRELWTLPLRWETDLLGTGVFVPRWWKTSRKDGGTRPGTYVKVPHTSSHPSLSRGLNTDLQNHPYNVPRQHKVPLMSLPSLLHSLGYFTIHFSNRTTVRRVSRLGSTCNVQGLTGHIYVLIILIITFVKFVSCKTNPKFVPGLRVVL